MTLIRALPDLSPQLPQASARPAAQEKLQRLEALARQELQALQQQAGASPDPAPEGELVSLAWDLGLDAGTLPR